MIPPAAITGSSTRSRTCGTSAIVPTSPASKSAAKVPRWPPASLPWATTASQPASSALAASAAVVAVPITVTPASPQRGQRVRRREPERDAEDRRRVLEQDLELGLEPAQG